MCLFVFLCLFVCLLHFTSRNQRMSFYWRFSVTVETLSLWRLFAFLVFRKGEKNETLMGYCAKTVRDSSVLILTIHNAWHNTSHQPLTFNCTQNAHRPSVTIFPPNRSILYVCMYVCMGTLKKWCYSTKSGSLARNHRGTTFGAV